jgi:hypothetical protein
MMLAMSHTCQLSSPRFRPFDIFGSPGLAFVTFVSIVVVIPFDVFVVATIGFPAPEVLFVVLL